jgi:hypothetical protein
MGIDSLLPRIEKGTLRVFLAPSYAPDAPRLVMTAPHSRLIREVCNFGTSVPCPEYPPRSLDLSTPQVVHQDTIVVPYGIDARRRPVFYRTLFSDQLITERQLEVGILPGPRTFGLGHGVLHFGRPTLLVFARAFDGWDLVRIDPPSSQPN